MAVQQLEERRLLVLDPLRGIDHVFPDSAIPAVVKVESRTFFGEPTMGTGVLVRPQWVLTAAHVIQGNGGGVNGPIATMKIGGNDYEAVLARAYLPDVPSDQVSEEYLGKDIALLKLDRPVSNVQPIPLFSSTPPPNQYYQLVGYGRTGTGLTGAVEGTGGRKRAGYVWVDEVKPLYLRSEFSTGSIEESHSAPGDSGGPLLIHVPVQVDGETDFRYFVAGIVQAGESPGLYGQDSFYTRVDVYRDWAYGIMSGHANPPVGGRFVTADGVSQEGGGADLLPPEITGGPVFGFAVADATSPQGAPVTFPEFQVTDNLDLSPQITYSHPSGSVFPIGSTQVTVTATDADGNSSSLAFLVVVTTPITLEGFAAPLRLMTGQSPRGTARGDFNRDGNPDFAVTHPDDSTVSVLLGNGDGTFAPARTYEVQEPYAVVAADFDGDGDEDLAMASFLGGIAVLHNSGTGEFAATPSVYEQLGIVGQMAAADLDGDQRPDLMAILHDGFDVKLITLTSRAGFSATPNIKVLVPRDFQVSPRLTTGDFNGDGRWDAAVALYGDADGAAVQILLGNGDGTFADPTAYAIDRGALEIVLADFNQDGFADLALACTNPAGVNILLGRGDGTFHDASRIPVSPPRLIVGGDFNVDGRSDLIIRSDDSTTTTLLGKGDGTFLVETRAIDVGSSDWNFARSDPTVVADFNRDGAPDIVIADGFETVTLLLNEAIAPPSVQARDLSGTEASPLGPVIVATFSDGSSRSTAADFTASINWGDGSVAAGIVAPHAGGGFDVLADHVYLRPGQYAVSVSVRKLDLPAVVAGSQATIANVPPQLTAGDVSLSSGQVSEGETLTLNGRFTDVGTSSAYFVLIDWGAGLGFSSLELAGDVRSFELEHVYDLAPDATRSNLTITVTVRDDRNGTGSVSIPLTVIPENRAPILDNSGTTTLPDLIEDRTNHPGVLISAVLSPGGNSLVSDLDAEALAGIAVVGLDQTHGTWQFSLDNGANWLSLGAPVNSSARLLANNASTRLRFVPSPDFFGSIPSAMTFRAWDQTTGANGGVADTTANGGTTAFSTATRSVSVNVLPVNDPPTFTATDPPAVNEDAPLQTIAGWAAFDPGPANESNQTAAYTLTNLRDPSFFAVLPSVSPDGTLRYQPAPNAVGTATFNVRVHDNGGRSNGGLDISVTRTFTVTVIDRPDELLITAAGAGGGPHVRVLDAPTREERLGFFAYDVSFSGGVRVATGDVNGDGTPDVITAPGPGSEPRVWVFDGVTGEPLEGPLGSFLAYHPDFKAGLFVASGDVNGDGRDDIITGAGAGGGPHVRVFSGMDGRELLGFFAYHPNFIGGVQVAAGDVNGDGTPDIITGPGAGGGPHVKVFDGRTGVPLPGAIGSFFAYHPNFGGGVFVAAGDVDDDGRADVITGPGAGGGPHVKVFSSSNGSVLGEFFAYHPNFGGGVRVAGGDRDGDGRAEIITAPGPGGGPHVRVFELPGPVEVDGFFAYHPNFSGGVFVAGSLAGSGAGLRFAGDAVAGATVDSTTADSITAEQLELIRAAAIARWEAALGSNSERSLLAGSADFLSRFVWTTLERTTFELADLPGDLLGLVRGGRVLIDRNAAGRGWFVDPTPETDDEFVLPAGLAVAPALTQREREMGVDLLTAVLHELGHVLGLEHEEAVDPADALMAEELGPGVRRLPTTRLVDDLFARW